MMAAISRFPRVKKARLAAFSLSYQAYSELCSFRSLYTPKNIYSSTVLHWILADFRSPFCLRFGKIRALHLGNICI